MGAAAEEAVVDLGLGLGPLPLACPADPAA